MSKKHLTAGVGKWWKSGAGVALGSVTKFCRGFGVGAKLGVGVCAKFEAGFGVGAKTG